MIKGMEDLDGKTQDDIEAIVVRTKEQFEDTHEIIKAHISNAARAAEALDIDASMFNLVLATEALLIYEHLEGAQALKDFINTVTTIGLPHD